MLWPLSMTLTLGLLAQDKPDPDDPATRLATMQASAATYDIRRVDRPNHACRFQPEPVLRFTNTVGDTRDGTIFLWFDEGDRPIVAAQVYMKRDGNSFHELTSLSTGLLVGRNPGAPDWRPSRSGVEFKPVPGAPKPADSAEQRLQQMQAMARDFSAEDSFRRQSWQDLRMLTRPLARYGKPGAEATDGAVFAYVLTTDPEVYLKLEARAGKDGAEWQYAFAPMTIHAVRASWKGQAVWELPNRWLSASKPDQPFYFRQQFAKPEGPKP
jgi:hypothetical protein